MKNRLFLDSNVFIWSLDSRVAGRLPAAVRRGIEAADHVFVSIASPWELWIKAAKGRLSMPADVSSRIAEAGYELLTIDLDDARLAASLPLLHKDPFDRMIVAQAMNRKAVLVTSDTFLPGYGVQTLLV